MLWNASVWIKISGQQNGMCQRHGILKTACYVTDRAVNCFNFDCICWTSQPPGALLLVYFLFPPHFSVLVCEAERKRFTIAGLILSWIALVFFSTMVLWVWPWLPNNSCPFRLVQSSRYIHIAQVRFTIIRLRLISRCAAISFTVTRRFSFTMVSTAAMVSGVTTRCAWPGRGESVTELMPFMNFLVSSYTWCNDRHASPHWTYIRPWISMGFTPSLLKKTDDRTLFFFGACCKRGRHPYTTTAPSCCVPASYCHLLATLQTMSIIVVNLQDIRAVFRIFVAL